jgi:hypothetical protein
LGDQQPGRHQHGGGAVRVDRIAGRQVGVHARTEPAELFAQLLQLGGWQAGADAAVAHHAQAVRSGGPRRGDQVRARADRVGPGEHAVRGGQVHRGELGGRQGPGGVVGELREFGVDPEQPRGGDAVRDRGADRRLVEAQREAQVSAEHGGEPVADLRQDAGRKRGGLPATDRREGEPGQQALQHRLLHDPYRRGFLGAQRWTVVPQPLAQAVQVLGPQVAGTREARRPVGAVPVHHPAGTGVGDRGDRQGAHGVGDAFVAAEVAQPPGVDLIQRRRVRVVAGRVEVRVERVRVVHLSGGQVDVAVERHGAGPARHPWDVLRVHRHTCRGQQWSAIAGPVGRSGAVRTGWVRGRFRVVLTVGSSFAGAPGCGRAPGNRCMGTVARLHGRDHTPVSPVAGRES